MPLFKQMSNSPKGVTALFFIQLFSTLGFAVLYSTLVLYATKHLHFSTELGYLRIPAEQTIKIEDVESYPPEQIVEDDETMRAKRDAQRIQIVDAIRRETARIRLKGL